MTRRREGGREGGRQGRATGCTHTVMGSACAGDEQGQPVAARPAAPALHEALGTRRRQERLRLAVAFSSAAHVCCV